MSHRNICITFPLLYKSEFNQTVSTIFRSYWLRPKNFVYQTLLDLTHLWEPTVFVANWTQIFCLTNKPKWANCSPSLFFPTAKKNWESTALLILWKWQHNYCPHLQICHTFNAYYLSQFIIEHLHGFPRNNSKSCCHSI